MIVLWGMRPMAQNEQYIGRDTTTAIKGIFAVIILISHIRPIVTTPSHSDLDYFGTLDSRIVADAVLNFLGQLIVVMFLAYSGFGIMESYRRKRDSYLNGFLIKRVLKTLLHFDIAVAFFFVLTFLFDKHYSASDYALCWTGWTSIGNSNWFIFDIIVLYLIAYFALLFSEKYRTSEWTIVFSVALVTFIFSIIMMKAKPGQNWWCDTLLAFPAGMAWSAGRTRFERAMRSQIVWTITFISSISLFLILHHIGQNMLLAGMFASAAFAFVVILATMRIRVGNPALQWLGANAFAIYILQRIPMIIATEFGINVNPILFMAIVIPSSLLIAGSFTRFTNKIDYLFKKQDLQRA